MSDIVNWMQQLPEPDRLALTTRFALLQAQLDAMRMQAGEIQPEHLLLGLIKQNDARIVRMCTSLDVDLATIYMYLHLFPKHPVVQKGSESGFFKKRLELEQRAFQEWLQSSHQEDSAELNQAVIEHQWRIAEEQYRNGELLKARVIDCNRGGLIVDISGIRGFVPISQILNLSREEVALGGDNQEAMAKLLNMKGKELQLKIIEINRERKRLVLSERLAYQEWRQRRREELLDELKPGEIRRGVVSNIANFGIFVDLGGGEGLVQTDQLSWGPVNHPGELFKVGQQVEVQVLSVDKEKKKIALSIKHAQADPWKTVEQRYVPGQVVTGVITKIAPFGVFACIEDGVEGLIRLSELTPGMDPKTSLHEGQHLQLRILGIDSERRRLSLSLRQVGELGIEEVSTEESSEKNHVDDSWLSPHEDPLKAAASTTAPDAGEGKDGLLFSQEALECLNWAISFAKHLHSTVVYPDHLLLSVLLQKRIQSYLAALLPSSEVLLGYFTGETMLDVKSTVFHSGVCPSCKQSTLSGWKHCVYCGASLARVCPKCGAPYPEIEGARFCFECGEPLEE
jgi:predicted RNA-binding protein with RPS1 domain